MMGNYLRVRGEYLWRDGKIKHDGELPPRARRIHPIMGFTRLGVGTTSACAENTIPGLTPHISYGNYLRVRGEYSSKPSLVPDRVELPPRARRIPAGKKTLRRWAGTTSACAENTILPNLRVSQLWNYLRVRGEYPHDRPHQLHQQELPPRARRILSTRCAPHHTDGTTSACAENTTTCDTPH